MKSKAATLAALVMGVTLIGSIINRTYNSTFINNARITSYDNKTTMTLQNGLVEYTYIDLSNDGVLDEKTRFVCGGAKGGMYTVLQPTQADQDLYQKNVVDGNINL